MQIEIRQRQTVEDNDLLTIWHAVLHNVSHPSDVLHLLEHIQYLRNEITVSQDRIDEIIAEMQPDVRRAV